MKQNNMLGKDGLTITSANHLANIAKEIGALKSLIAYLREGIKAKNQMNSDAAFEGHVEELIKAGRKDLEKPKAEKEVTFEDEFVAFPISVDKAFL